MPNYAVGAISEIIPDDGFGAAVADNAFEKEDEYRQFYLGGDRDLGVLEPPYRLRQLQRLTQENNALGPCIEAMVTNIDGTGYDFDNGDDEEAEDDADDVAIEELQEFFAQPWPGMSFKKMRRMVRRDVESIGNGYMEVLRNASGDIVFIRPIDGKMMRMIKLDQAVAVTKKLTRNGKDVEYKVSMRERRYCQLVNGITLVYFKEFGASRDLNKKTGTWALPGQQLPANIRATEVLHFQALPDAHTPYGIPRWVAQVPSVMGSRKAEEFNLSYFDNGGIPPIMIVLQGGLLQSETRRKLEQMTSGTAAQNNRLQVVEVEPTGGSLEGNAPVAKVTVERFGGDRMADCHDDQTEVLTQRGFVLFKDLEQTDLVATLNGDQMELQQPTRHAAQPYSGSMIRCRSNAVDLKVTPDHDLWCRRSWLGPYQMIKAHAVNHSHAMITNAEAAGLHITSVSIPHYRKRIDHPSGLLSFPAELMLRFIGLYVGDGSVAKERGYSIRLGARSAKKVIAFTDSVGKIVTHLPAAKMRSYAINGGGSSIEFSDKSIALWLKENVGLYQTDRRLPAWCLTLNAAQSQILLDDLFTSDGSQCEGRNAWAYRSASEHLIDDVQVVALRAGCRATKRQEGERYWRVNIVPYAREIAVASFATEHFQGMVYRLTVPNKLMFTRRNGCVVVSGN